MSDTDGERFRMPLPREVDLEKWSISELEEGLKNVSGNIERGRTAGLDAESLQDFWELQKRINMVLKRKKPR